MRFYRKKISEGTILAVRITKFGVLGVLIPNSWAVVKDYKNARVAACDQCQKDFEADWSRPNGEISA